MTVTQKCKTHECLICHELSEIFQKIKKSRLREGEKEAIYKRLHEIDFFVRLEY